MPREPHPASEGGSADHGGPRVHLEVQRNVRIYYLYSALMGAAFFHPVVAVFYQSKGLSFAQITLTQTIYYVAKSILDVPTGALADRLSRRLALFLGSITLAAGSSFILFSPGFGLLVVGEVLRGCGLALTSGANKALLYDFLAVRSSANRFIEVQGRASAISLLSLVVTGAAGGLFASVTTMSLPYIATIAVLLMSAVTVLLLREERPVEVRHGPSRTTIFGTMARAVRLVARNPRIAWLLAASTVVYAAERSIFWFYQPYLAERGVDVAYFGAIWVGFPLLMAIGSWNAARLSSALGLRVSLIVLGACVALPVFSMATCLPAAVTIALLYLNSFARGFSRPIITTMMNDQLPSDIRATALSVNSQLDNLAVALVFPALGHTADVFSLGDAMVILGLALTLGVGALALARRAVLQEPR